MQTLYQQLSSTSLADTLTQLENDIKTQPANADLRAAFVQLLCLAGNWGRALIQLKSWLALKPQAKPTITLLEQAIAGEQRRIEVMEGRARPNMPDTQWPWLTPLLAALSARNADTASTQREAAFAEAEINPGELTSQERVHRFDWLMDGDARLGPVCEVIVNGRYFWLPFSAIAEMRFQAPSSVTDLVWRHTSVRLVDGTEQVCQIPARYPLMEDTEDRFLLARATEWEPINNGGEQYLGIGQKVWLNDSDEFPLLSLDSLIFSVDEDRHD
ncbi:protein of avirulence locus ImpE [Brenneria izadpanahii]|uniref:Protein of avirulence locus ImpE n=1 Tax=Brenneria izadpanahii TaxID=2722756 RepID=A0ABX7UY74_9GAMM|nr:type VI secretion system accessory protein TagJ [Brenneria izadpanahii]QTF10721.1 protein of avirulence locus ImpE [Brenneria izadpanahii]